MIDLKDRYGKRFKVTMDPSWDLEVLDKNQENIVWYYEIRGSRGYIYPQSEASFALELSPRIYEKIRASNPFPTIKRREADDLVTLIVDETHLDLAVKYIKPRNKRVLSPLQRQRNIERLAKYRFSSARRDVSSLVKSPSNGGSK